MSTKGKIQLDTLGVANRLVQLCASGNFSDAQKELFAERATSTEPENTKLPVARGLNAIQEKGKQFQSQVKEVHKNAVGLPIVAQNHFAISLSMDYTGNDGRRQKMDEICLYKVENGEIVSEQFFY